MQIPKTSLEQWAILAAVVDEGSFARAAEVLNRSQSSVSYALKTLQQQLPVDELEQQGRRAQLTDAGEVLLRRARVLLSEMGSLERLAAGMEQGWETEVRLAVDVVFPPARLAVAMNRFVTRDHPTRVQMTESVLSGTQEALMNGQADLAIVHQPPVGFWGTELLNLEFVAVASSGHELFELEGAVTHQDLARYRQFVVRDSGLKRSQDSGWLGAEQRWTVSHIKTSIQFVTQGLGFAWLPEEHIRQELDSGALRAIPLAEGARRTESLFLVFADRDSAGPATRALADEILAACSG